MNSKNPNAKVRKFNLIDGFYIIFSLALISRIACDFFLNRIGIHSGEIYPLRKWNQDEVPYSTMTLYFEWFLIFLGAILINFKFKKFAALLIIIGLCMSLSQMLQNQKILMLIISICLLISPLHIKNERSIWFLKFQLLLLYVFSAFQKLNKNFLSGDDLSSTLNYLNSIEGNSTMKAILGFALIPSNIVLLSWVTVILELILPIILIKKPKLGVLLVIILHFSFNILLRDILPFTLTTLALATVFLVPQESKSDDIPNSKLSIFIR